MHIPDSGGNKTSREHSKNHRSVQRLQAPNQQTVAKFESREVFLFFIHQVESFNFFFFLKTVLSILHCIFIYTQHHLNALIHTQYHDILFVLQHDFFVAQMTDVHRDDAHQSSVKSLLHATDFEQTHS